MKGKALLWATWVMPMTAMAQDAAGPSGNVDVYYVPKANIELRQTHAGVSVDEKGDGYGVRSLLHLSDLFMVTGEYQSVSYDLANSDRDDYRLGAGLGLPTGTGLFVEYVSILDGTGFGAYGRYAGQLTPSLALQAQAGYVQVEDVERMGGFEFSVGGAYAITRMFSAMLDYRVTSLEGAATQAEYKLRDLRVGLRWNFGASAMAPESEGSSEEEGVSVEPVSGEEAPVDEAPAAEAPAEQPAEINEPAPVDEPAPAEEAPAG